MKSKAEWSIQKYLTPVPTAPTSSATNVNFMPIESVVALGKVIVRGLPVAGATMNVLPESRFVKVSLVVMRSYLVKTPPPGKLTTLLSFDSIGQFPLESGVPSQETLAENAGAGENKNTAPNKNIKNFVLNI